jgi:hypothetical protein
MATSGRWDFCSVEGSVWNCISAGIISIDAEA